jgi:polysaccharide biosynthesis transport protein
MTEFDAEPTFRSYVMLLRRRKWWVTTLALLGLAISLTFTLTARKQYSATAQILVQSPVDQTTPGVTQPPVTQTDVETELTLVSSAPIVDSVRRQLGAVPGITAAEVGQTNVIAITATSPSPPQAARVANAYARDFVAYRQATASQNLAAAESQLRAQIDRLAHQLGLLHGRAKTSAVATALASQLAVLKEQLAQMQVSAAADIAGVELVTPAQTPTSPSSPQPALDALLGLAAGLLTGLGAAFARDSLDDRLSSKEAAEHAGSAPVLALVPMVPSWRRRQKAMVVALTEPTSPTAESYRSLRTSLQFARQEGQLRSLMVTSPAASEGKTSTLANLGVVFAQAGDRVLMVSCDLRRPRLGEFFGLDERTGLTTVLAGQQELEKAIQPVRGHDRLWVLGAGRVPTNPAELLNQAAAGEVFGALAERFDLVLIDSPPLLPVTDAVVLSQHADATLMVVAAGQTRKADLRRAAEKLHQVGVTVLGTVLNGVTKQTGYGYGYGYGYGNTYKPYLSDAPNGTAPRGGKAPVSDSSPR